MASAGLLGTKCRTRARKPLPVRYASNATKRGRRVPGCRVQQDSGVQGLLLLGGAADVVPTPGSYPAEESEARTFAPARLGATAAESRTANSQCVGGAGARG